MALLYPSVASDAMRSLSDHTDQKADKIVPGFLFPYLENGGADIFGGNEFALPAQAYAFGARAFDTASAVDKLVQNSTVPGFARAPKRSIPTSTRATCPWVRAVCPSRSR